MSNTPMHFAVSTMNLSLVRMLDEYNADASIQNVEGLSPIDIAVAHDIKDIKLHFMAQPKYKSYDFTGAL